MSRSVSPLDMMTPTARTFVELAQAAEGRGWWPDARSHYHDALVAIRATDDRGPAALLFRRIARCHAEQAEWEPALDCISVARATSAAQDDIVGLAHADNLEGIIAQMRGDLLSAERLYREASKAARSTGDGALVAMIHQNLGTVANIRGEHQRARAHYEAALRGYRALGMQRPLGPLLDNLGMLYTDLKDWQHAERCFTDAMASCRDADDMAGYWRAAANRVEMFVERRRFRKARQLCRKILQGNRDGCSGTWVAEAHKFLGVIERETGHPDRATRHLTLALSIASDREDRLLEAEVLRELASVHHMEERYRETLASLNRAHKLFEQLSARPDLTDLARRRDRLESQFLELVREWGSSIESADRYTQGHCERVADVACKLAEDVGFDEQTMLWFRMGALLHDVGKITVPIHVLNKTDRLTDEEFEQVKLHPVAGEELLSGVEFPWDVKPMIRHHHERWDGAGYPDRLAGENIPLTARVLCIADVYDALTTTRSYRIAYAPERAAEIMASDAGRAFDPELLHVFLTRSLPELLGRPIELSGAPRPDERSGARDSEVVVMRDSRDRPVVVAA